MQKAEFELHTKSYALVAQYMYQEWKKAMQPPVFRVLSFEDWLQTIIDRKVEK